MQNILNKLPPKIELNNGLYLVLDTKIHKGINNLSDISWYEYKIINNEEFGIIYDNVCLSFFSITESIRFLASKNIVENGVSKKETVRPHIDYKTGNIHPSKEYVLTQNDGIIKQLILCKGLGPNTPKEQFDDYYIYKNRPRQRGTKIHKACYYPLIDDNQNLENDWRYQMLDEIWNIICISIKS